LGSSSDDADRLLLAVNSTERRQLQSVDELRPGARRLASNALSSRVFDFLHLVEVLHCGIESPPKFKWISNIWNWSVGGPGAADDNIAVVQHATDNALLYAD